MARIESATLPRDERGNDPNDFRHDPTYLDGLTIEDTTPPDMPPPFQSLALTDEELQAARLTPTCIVQDYLYADVGVLAAPGGTGKTSLMLFEMVHIALGRDVHGQAVKTPGWCLFVTAEDRREQLAARLREMMASMELADDERRTVLDRLRFWDVTGEQVKLVANLDGNVTLTRLADNIADAYRDDPPVIVTFDPIVSFGASEGMVNDNEQALVTAARRIVRAFDCCVRLIAHTGKANAREKTLDQYTSRGGSALPDGARMMAVLQPWNQDAKGDRTPPPGCAVTPGASLTILARPKLSYAPADLPLIWIRREGWRYESFTEIRTSPEERKRALVDQVETFLESEVKRGNRHTRNTLEQAPPDTLTRKEVRQALAVLTAEGRIVELDLPKEERHGRRKTYISTRRLSADCGGIENDAP